MELQAQLVKAQVTHQHRPSSRSAAASVPCPAAREADWWAMLLQLTAAVDAAAVGAFSTCQVAAGNPETL
jgi:hypothetical protein